MEPEEGDAEQAARRPSQRDGQPRRALAPAHTHAHSLPAAPPRDRGVPGILRRTPQAGTYSCHLYRGQLSPGQRQPPPPPAASGSSHPPAWVRAGRPSPPPLGSPRRLHHIPPWSVAHARGRARGSGTQGCAYIARLLLAAHTVHGSEGASEGGTGPSAAPTAAAAPAPSSAPPHPRSGDHRTGIPPPPSPCQARRRGP